MPPPAPAQTGLARLPDDGVRRRAPVLRAVGSFRESARLGVGELSVVLATLAVLVALNLPELGEQGWRFRPGAVEPNGLLAPLVSAAGKTWNTGALRAGALAAGLLVALIAARAWRGSTWRPSSVAALTAIVVALLLVPAVALQVGLRQATAPWFFANDSTQQIELAGERILARENPYGRDYAESGLERFYSLDGRAATNPDAHPALDHFAYFPGTPLSAAAWRTLPAPFDDYRVLVLLATLGTLVVALLFDAPLHWRLAVGAALAANPLAVKAAWFGTADAVSLVLVLLAFALVSRSRLVAAAAALGAAVLLKQFALVAVPFLAVMLVTHGADRTKLRGAAAAFVGVLAAGFAPFLLADAPALWDDTVAYGVDTYTIMGYGLAPLLVHFGLLDGRSAGYPFAVIALLAWLPLTAWLLWNQARSRALWVGAAGFAVSMFALLFIARVFHPSYLLWPLTGVAAAVLFASPRASVALRAEPSGSPSSARASAA